MKTNEQPSYLLNELLAVIHGDGGHYQDRHGTPKAVQDAIKKWHAATARQDQALAATADDLRQVASLVDAIRTQLLRGKQP